MGTWSNTPDGGYSYTPGFLQGAPPGGAYVPAQYTPGAPGNITPARFDYPSDCKSCKKAKDEQDKKAKSQGLGTKLGSCTSATRSFGVVSDSALVCTDTNGNTFTASSVGYGVSQPGWSAASWDAYSFPDSPAGTTMQDVVGGSSWQGGVLDNTSMNGSGYMLQTGGSPNLLSLEHTTTTIYGPSK